MLRIFTRLILLVVSLQVFSVQADETADYAEITSLQESIQRGISRLGEAKGEWASFREYRLNTHLAIEHKKLSELMSRRHLSEDAISPYIRQHLLDLARVNDYYGQKVKGLSSSFGKDSDRDLMLEISRHEQRRDEIYQAKYETLEWAKKLDIDVTTEVAELTRLLETRGDRVNSLVNYTRDNLRFAEKELKKAGKTPEPEQVASVSKLTELLALDTASLKSTIELLDLLEKDTSLLKNSLLISSGEITQDVLNFKVAKNLVDGWFDSLGTSLKIHGPDSLFKLFMFILVVFVTLVVSKGVKKVVRSLANHTKKRMSRLLLEFLVSLSGKLVIFVGLLFALSQMGFNTGALLAGFGVVGVIVGLALQDTLSNFASGMMILFYRPYDVGDLIGTGDVTGIVSHMSLVSTIVKTYDNQRLIIPNSKIWSETINNRTVEGVRRIDMTFGAGYSEDIEKVERVLQSIVDEHPLVLKHPEPSVHLHTLGESSVDFVVRPWVRPDNYWDVYWDVTRSVKMRFDEENISIPFPQRDLHIYKMYDKADDKADALVGVDRRRSIHDDEQRRAQAEKPIDAQVDALSDAQINGQTDAQIDDENV